MLLAVLDGQSLPLRSIMPAQLVVRESCGCTAKSLSLASIPSSDSEPGPPAVNVSHERLPDDLLSIARDLEIPVEHVEILVDLLRSDLSSGTSHRFLPALKRHLIETMGLPFGAIDWQNAISVLRRYVLSISGGEIGAAAETLFNQARVVAAEVYQHASIKQRLETEQLIENLRRTSETLITSFGRQLLVDTLHEYLPGLGFPSFYLSLYDDPHQPAAWSHLILAYANNQRLDLPPKDCVSRPAS